MPAGRPLKFKTVKELEEKIEAYLSDCQERNLPITITGMALWLDTTRDLLCNYENKDEFADTIKRAKMLVEYSYECKLHSGNNAAGMIFALKNFGWKDKIEQDTTLTGDLKVSWEE